MTISFFEFLVPGGARRRLKCDIDDDGLITFITQSESTGGGSSNVVATFPSPQPVTGNGVFSVDWSGVKNFAVVGGANNANKLEVDANGAIAVTGSIAVSNLVSVGFQSAQPVNITNVVSVGFQSPQSVQFATPQRVLGNQNFTISRFITPANNIAQVRTVSSRLSGFRVENLANSIRYLLFFNQTTAPTAGQSTNILDGFAVSPGNVLIVGSDYFGSEGVNCSGIFAVFSTARGGYTNSGANEMDLSVISVLN